MHPRYFIERLSWKALLRRLSPYRCITPHAKESCTAIIFLSVTALCIPENCYSGNKWMMEKNKQELLLLNSELLKHLSSIKKNGEIILRGSVIYRDGKTILKIQEMQDFSSGSVDNPTNNGLPREGEDYEVFLREESLPEIPIDAEAKELLKSDNKLN